METDLVVGVEYTLIDIAAAGEITQFVQSRPYLLHRFGVSLDEASVTSAISLHVEHHYAGSAVIPLERTGTIVIPTGAAARGFYQDAAEFSAPIPASSSVNVSQSTGRPILVLPGEYIVVISAGGTGATDAWVFYEIELLPFQDVLFNRPSGIPLTTPDDAVLNTTLSHATKLTA